MKEIVGVIDTIAVPARKGWEGIAAIGGGDKWASMITSCRVEGGGPGEKRFCTMADGTDLEEVVEEVDHGAMRFRYRIVRGLPVESYQGTIEIRAAGNAHPEITWYSAYAASEEIAEEFRQMLRGMLPGLIKGLEHYCRN